MFLIQSSESTVRHLQSKGKQVKKNHLISVRIRKVQQHREKKGSSLLTRCFAELSAYAIAMRAGGIYHILSLLSSKCLDNSSTSTEKS